MLYKYDSIELDEDFFPVFNKKIQAVIYTCKCSIRLNGKQILDFDLKEIHVAGLMGCEKEHDMLKLYKEKEPATYNAIYNSVKDKAEKMAMDEESLENYYGQ